MLAVFLACVATGDILAVPKFDVTAGELANYLSVGPNISFPALYAFGDSFLDAGNNKYLASKAQANFTPYGVDFGTGGGKATGRFSNGRTVVDFLAQLAGLPFPPPYYEAKRTSVATGVNFASASAGVLPEPDGVRIRFGDFLTLDEQLNLFEKVKEEMGSSTFHNSQSLESHLSKSIFFVHMSSNDMGIYWDFFYSSKYGNVAEPYVQFLSTEFKKRLERLYELGARKFVVNNVSPLGCIPFQRHNYHPKTECVEEANLRVSKYNNLLALMLPKLQLSLPGSKFVFVDLYKIFLDAFLLPDQYGFDNVHDDCCIDQNHDGTGSCLLDSVPCEDRNGHMYFDSFHPTESIHFIWARRLLKDQSVCHPCTLLGLLHPQ